jgi:hypothetical protein
MVRHNLSMYIVLERNRSVYSHFFIPVTEFSRWNYLYKNQFEQTCIYTYKFMCISITKIQKMNSYYLAKIFYSHIILKREIQGTMDPIDRISIYHIQVCLNICIVIEI